MSKKFRVRSVEFRVHEDSFNDGEGNLLAIWTEENLPFRNTIEQALADIMHFCELQKDIKKLWNNDPCSNGEFSRFDANVTIDWDFAHNAPIMHPTAEDFSDWQMGKRMLYAMHGCAHIEVISDLTADDVKDFGNA